MKKLIISIIIILVLTLGIGTYFIFFMDSSKINSEHENNIIENGESERIERSSYFNIINNIKDYEGEELIFNNVTFSNNGGYRIVITEEDGTSIFLLLIQDENTILLPRNGFSPNFWPTSNKWNFVGVVEKESNDYFLKLSKAEAIFIYS